MEKGLIIDRQNSLTGAALRALAPVMGGHDFGGEIQQGIAELWRINGGAAWMITRVEGSELVVCCLAGRDLLPVCAVLYRAASLRGLSSIRFHTGRRGLARLVNRGGYGASVEEIRPGERVYRVRVK